uniref:Peptidase S1 domain-containing protein n=1 Tax=Sus scrofa TaxID=9823 RepID=A0A4X1U670_PIG
ITPDSCLQICFSKILGQSGGHRGVSTACGKPKVMWRISGGQDVVAGQWPWQASLMYQGLHVCGAVLINSRWLVSAAHSEITVSQGPHISRFLSLGRDMGPHVWRAAEWLYFLLLQNCVPRRNHGH